jgi:hypothetical protein
MPYIPILTPRLASPDPPQTRRVGVMRTKVMTIEILHLTAQIQRWLNRRIARHLAEQAERLAR